jgi:hypothetical protein
MSQKKKRVQTTSWTDRVKKENKGENRKRLEQTKKRHSRERKENWVRERVKEQEKEREGE